MGGGGSILGSCESHWTNAQLANESHVLAAQKLLYLVERQTRIL
jgi:hypothetical protein